MNRATVLVLLGGLALTAAFIVAPGAVATGPFLPKSDAEVLEVVPRSTPRASSAPLTAAQAAYRARQLIDEAQRNGGDPRLLGRAQAVLAPWWNDASPLPEILLLRAELKQRFHDFEGALVDLDARAAVQPLDPQTWLTRATVLAVLARYADAEASCEKLPALASDVVTGICRARLSGLQGHAAQAVSALDALQPSVVEQPWLLAVRGELQHWSGDDTRAAAALEQALTLDPTDTDSRLLLAQIHLDQGQPARAAKLFEGRVLNDGELLMLVLASPARRAELELRVAANRQRGETLYQREESRYALALEGDPAKALQLASSNWAVQKEPADARVLLEAAVAAKDAKAAAPVLQWLAQTKFSEPRLRALAKELP